MSIEVSIITTIYNGEKWLNQCLESVYKQTYRGLLEYSIYNDGSTDNSKSIIEYWTSKLKTRDINVILSGHTGLPRGVGHGKNVAVRQSAGKYLCFLDSDDEMDEYRIEKQLQAAKTFPNAIIGCRFYRVPADSTKRYTEWANNLSPKQLYTQAYTSHGPTVVMPTWFCSRAVFHNVGAFDERGKGVPEDLIFFYHHLEIGGELYRLDEDLMMYRYHTEATTFSIDRKTIWMLRIEFLEKQVLKHWSEFTIWNAGKQGRRFFRSLSTENQKKVCMFCDVDNRKINKGSYTYENSQEVPKPQVPIFHFTQAKTPIIICVKLDLTGGVFEDNLKSLNLIEGVDYFHFN